MYGVSPWQSAYSYGAGAPGQSPYFSGSPYYSSPYSSYNSMRNPYAPGPGMPMNGAMPMNGPTSNSVLDRVHNGFSSVGSVTEALARVTGMLDSNWHSLFMSFASMVRLVEGVHVMRGEFWSLLKALSIAKLLHSLYEWFRPPVRPLLADPSANASEFINAVGSRRRSYWKLLAVLVGLAMLVGPWFYSRLMARVKRTRVRRRDTLGDNNDDSDTPARDSRGARLVPGEADAMPVSRFFECINDYEALSSRELSLRRGDIVHVAARVGQRWLAVERRDGARGLVPTTVMRPYDEDMRRFGTSSSGRRHNRHRRSTLRASRRLEDDDNFRDDDDDDDDDDDTDGKAPANSSRSRVAMTREEAARFGTPRATSDREVATSGGGRRQRRPFSDEEVEWWAEQRR